MNEDKWISNFIDCCIEDSKKSNPSSIFLHPLHISIIHVGRKFVIGFSEANNNITSIEYISTDLKSISKAIEFFHSEKIFHHLVLEITDLKKEPSSFAHEYCIMERARSTDNPNE